MGPTKFRLIRQAELNKSRKYAEMQIQSVIFAQHIPESNPDPVFWGRTMSKTNVEMKLELPNKVYM